MEFHTDVHEPLPMYVHMRHPWPRRAHFQPVRERSGKGGDFSESPNCVWRRHSPFEEIGEREEGRGDGRIANGVPSPPHSLDFGCYRFLAQLSNRDQQVNTLDSTNNIQPSQVIRRIKMEELRKAVAGPSPPQSRVSIQLEVNSGTSKVSIY